MRTAALGTILALFAMAQDTTEKQELRFKLQKGEKLSVEIQQKMALKLEQIPEEYQEMFGEELFRLDFTGVLELEVRDVAEGGAASLEGKFRKMKAKGHAMINEIDYEYDADKAQPDRIPDEDPGTPYGMDPTQALEMLATQTLNLKVDPFGKLDLEGASEGSGEMASLLLSLNGAMGTLPKESVGVGDKWKSTETITLPALAQFKIGLRSENTVERFTDDSTAVIRSKLSVGTIGDETDSPDGGLFKTKMTGEGSGTANFSVKAGRVRSAESALKVKITATIGNPQDGSDSEFKGTLEIDRKHRIEE